MQRNMISVTALLLFSLPAFAAEPGMGGMAMSGPKPAAATMGYQFELAGPAKSAGGKSTVAVRLMHDGKPVTGAVIIQSRADMGPMGMAGMTAPIKPLGEKPPGTYLFEVANGPVWNKPDKWAMSFSAKVQGEASTIRGNVVAELKP